MKSHFMERALALAGRGRGKTSPNPMVGAVLVKSGKVVAEGWHKAAGGDHAEVDAIKNARGQAKGSTLYVTLEPCCHTGKTGPCTEAVIKAGIKKVVVATRDPNPLVCGKGISALKKAGITVMEGLLQKEARDLNLPFEKFITKKIPFVTLKAACSLDGKIAAPSGESKWITNELCRERVQSMRMESDAIMVGINTLLADDPSLNVRTSGKNPRQPLRVVLDTRLKTPLTANIFKSAGGNIFIIAGDDVPASRSSLLEKAGATVIRTKAKEGRVNLKEALEKLADNGVVNLLVEGGSELFTEALVKGLVDRAAIFYAPIIIGGTEKYSLMQGNRRTDLASAIRLADIKRTDFGDNFLIEGRIDG